MHLLAFHDLQLQDGETFSDHAQPARARDLRGTLTFLPAHSRAWGWWLPRSRESSVTTLYFDPRQMDERLATRFRQALFRPQLYFSNPDLRSTLGKLHDALKSADETDTSYMECLCALSALELCRLYRPAPRGRLVGQLTPAQKTLVTDYIEAHLAAGIGLTELADVVGLSRHHFLRAFKATTGETPYQFLLQRRIERARTLLAEGRMAVEEVGHAVGFKSAPAFIRAFRRLVGATPGQFRAHRAKSRDPGAPRGIRSSR